MSNCNHTKQNSWWVNDAQGIPLARVCSNCEQERLSQFRPEIIRGYTQEDVDEPIEPDYDWGPDRGRGDPLDYSPGPAHPEVGEWEKW